MKKFLMYVIIIVTSLFLGFTVYYLSLNDEVISLSISSEETMYLNSGDTFVLPINWTKAHEDTTLTITSADNEVLSYSEESKKFTAGVGGFTSVTISTSNRKFGPFVFNVSVGDGTINYPFNISKPEDIAGIGTRYDVSANFSLNNDIDLASYNNGIWTPISTFSGKFYGNGYTIYNLNVQGTGNAGLFAELKYQASFENVKFTNAIINGSFDNAGVVAGINNGLIGKVDVVSSNITNTKVDGYTGGIVGSNIKNTSNASINMCLVNTSITADGYAGGIAGYNKSSLIINSRAVVTNANIASENSCFGGLVGLNSATYQQNNGANNYTPSVIKHSYVLIDNMSGAGKFGGIVGKNDDPDFDGKYIYNTYIGTLYSLKDEVNIAPAGLGSENLQDAENNMVKVSRAQLKQEETYKYIYLTEEGKYDFTKVWVLEDLPMANLNFNAGYEIYNILDASSNIKDDTYTLRQFLELVKQNPTTELLYTVTSDTTYDIGATETSNLWTTVAPNVDQPMKASIIVEENVKCVIKNFILKDDNSSFFGHIGQNVTISGLTFENFEILNTTSDSSAVVAKTLDSTSTIKNVTVKNATKLSTTEETENVYEIDTKATTFGMIVATNFGTIENCQVTTDVDILASVKLYASSNLTNFGGIVGYNKGIIDGCSVHGLKLVIQNDSNLKANFNIGGVVAVTETGISNCVVTDAFKCEVIDNFISVFAGGLIGNTVSNKFEVISCYSMADLKFSPYAETYVAGLVTNTNANIIVKNCFYSSGELKGKYVAGLTSNNYGTFTSCYVGECVLEGYLVGGFTTNNYNKVTDCYVLAELKGVSADSNLNGFSWLVPEGSLFEHNFSNATFSGEGSYWVESKAPFRTAKWIQSFQNFFSNNSKYGEVKNNICLINNGAQFNNKVNSSNFIETTLKECNGSEGNYSVFKDTAGFDVNIWNFENAGSLPTLKNVVKAPEIEVPEQPETPVVPETPEA